MVLKKRSLLILSSAGMLLACFYAWTSFIFISFSRRPIAVSEAAMVMALAMLTTYFHHQRGWRRIVAVALHMAAFTISLLGIFYLYFGIESSLFPFGWFSDPFTAEKVGQEWPIIFLILIFAWILWFCGLRLITKPTDKAMISYRFDMGLGLFLFLFLIKLVLAGKAVSLPMAHSSTTVIIAYIVLGLFSMGLVHTRPSKTEGATYLKGIGTVLTFTLVVIMLGGGLFTLFLPQIQTVANAGFGLLVNLKEPIESIVITLSRFFLMRSYRRRAGEGVTGEGVSTSNLPDGEVGILHYLFIGMCLAVLLGIVGYLLYRLFRWVFSKLKWFFSKTAGNSDNRDIWERLLLIIGLVKNLYISFHTGLFKRSDTSRTAEKIYLRLLRWGKWSGLRRSSFVTPKEYGVKLGQRFPPIEKEIECIIEVHDEAVYGGILPEFHKIKRAKRALRTINHPYLWFARLKSLCFDNRF